MNQPTVACILLTRDRPVLARRAVECFRAQTYDTSLLRLRILYSGESRLDHSEILGSNPGIVYEPTTPKVIGALRNEANAGASMADIIIHWDDDDYSHPHRIAEQVALLQSSGADCVGYRECLFWRTHKAKFRECFGEDEGRREIEVGDAWLYSNGDHRSCIGSSLCYWRKTWEAHPFSEMNGPNPRVRGEDREFCRGIKCVGVSAVNWDEHGSSTHQHPEWPIEPRMICRIHSGNQHNYPVEHYAATGPHWKRASEWDARCREILG